MGIDVLTTVYIGNAIGIALLATLFLSNKVRLSHDSENKAINRLMIIAFLACVVDPIVYTVDGHPGIINTIIIYVGNSWLYVANMLTGRMWINFLSKHVNVKIGKPLRVTMDLFIVFGIGCLIVNVFYPIIFSVEGNVYERTSLYWIFVAIAGLLMVESIYLYYWAKFKGGIFTFFPVAVFIVPVVVGVIIQSAFYGISVIWTSVAIAIAGLSSSLKNEIIYMDKLTGIHNRMYLDYLQKNIYNRNNVYVTGMMIDLNDFKSINDRFGHATGDEALIITAEILRDTVGASGTVMRYAGDEFVVMLNTVKEEEVESIIGNINEAFDKFNAEEEKPYKLNIAYGYSALDLKNQTMNDFMNTIDKKMYEQKDNYYKARGSARRK